MKHSDWTKRWMDMCYLVASWSKDRSTKFGAVIVDDRQTVLSLGWNGMPRNICEDINARHKRPEKYSWFEHAERNAIYNAASRGIPLLGSILYVNGVPCPDCARGIIQSGIKKAIILNRLCSMMSAESSKLTLSMLAEARIETILLVLEEYHDHGSSNGILKESTC